MPQQISPSLASHLRSSRYVQRERPAASIPARIRARRLAGEIRRDTPFAVSSYSLYARAA